MTNTNTITRNIRNNNGDLIGKYEVLVEEPRQIYIDGTIVNDFSKLDCRISRSSQKPRGCVPSSRTLPPISDR